MTGQGWSERPEGGGYVALWLIVSIALRLGRPVARLLLFPITAYFLVVRGPERRASRAFLSRVTGRRASLLAVARHIHCFSATILDRVFLLSGRGGRLDVRVQGVESLHRLLDQGRGVLLLGAHVGSFEALRVLARERPGLQLRVLLQRGQNPALMQLLDGLDPAMAGTIIDAGRPGPELVLAMAEALRQGALVGLLADRARPGEGVAWQPFLGNPAPFPTAPMRIAATLGVPVVMALGLYRGGRRYDLLFETLAEGTGVPRGERAAFAATLQRRYVELLQQHVRDAPMNWFNFYDFWQGEPTDDTAADHAAA